MWISFDFFSQENIVYIHYLPTTVQWVVLLLEITSAESYIKAFKWGTIWGINLKLHSHKSSIASITSLRNNPGQLRLRLLKSEDVIKKAHATSMYFACEHIASSFQVQDNCASSLSSQPATLSSFKVWEWKISLKIVFFFDGVLFASVSKMTCP